MGLDGRRADTFVTIKHLENDSVAREFEISHHILSLGLSHLCYDKPASNA